MSRTENAAQGIGRHSEQKPGFGGFSLQSVPHLTPDRKPPRRRTVPAIRMLDRMIDAQRPRRFTRTTVRDDLGRARRSALLRFVEYHGTPQTRYTSTGEHLYFRSLALDRGLFDQLARLGWKRAEVLTTVREMCRFRGAFLDAGIDQPGSIEIRVFDQERHLQELVD